MALTKKKKKIAKSLPFDIYIRLMPTGEKFLLKSVNAEMKIRELKCYAELVVGIPSNLQRLQYLDEGDMMDESNLKYNDVVAGATIKLKIWRAWESLVASAARGNVENVFKQDIQVSKDWEKLDPLVYRNKVSLTNERAAVALFVAAHRGNMELVRSLLDSTSADVNMKTPFGRTPLHVASSQGYSLCIDIMLERGASIDEPDEQGKTPLMIASQCGFKDSERHLFLFQWQTRAARIKSRKKSTSLMMHQQFDSHFPIWFKGKHAQIYFCQTLPPGEFAGTGLNAPPLRKNKGSSQESKKKGSPDVELPPIAETQNGGHGSPNSPRKRFQPSRLLSSKSRSSLESSKSSTFDDWLQAKNEQKKKELQKIREEQARRDLENEMRKRGGTAGKSFEDWKQAKQRQKLSPLQPETKKDNVIYKEDADGDFHMSFQQWLRLKSDARNDVGHTDVYS